MKTFKLIYIFFSITFWFLVASVTAQKNSTKPNYYMVLICCFTRCELSLVMNTLNHRMMGPIVFWPGNTATGQWFAYIDCNSNSTSNDMITAQGNGSSAIVLYSKDESCTSPPILSDIKIPVFNEKYANCYNAISNSVQELGQPPNAVIRNSNKTGSRPDISPFKNNDGSSNSDTKDNSAQPYQTAMVVLYTISGVVLGLFFLVVITNVIINRVRSQQDSGIRSNNDSSQSPKHVGIAKTVLESFPVYFFSLRNNPDVVNKDLESGKDIKDIESKEMQTDDKNNIPLNDLSQETNKKDETLKISEIDGDEFLNNDKISNNQSILETSVNPPSISNKVTEEQLTCPICLGDFESGEELRILPCHHQYHTSCIDPWLLEISTLCPMCKADYTSWNEESSTSHGEASTSVVPTPPQNETDATTSSTTPSTTPSTTSSHAFPHFRWIKYLTSARRARNERRRNRRSRNGHSDNADNTNQTDQTNQTNQNES